MNPSAWRGITWALSAWIVAPVLMIAVVVFLGVVDRTMTTQSSESSSVPSSVSSESSSVPTCRADDFYCAPIYDPSATVILIRPASGAVPEIPAAWIDAEEDAAWTDTLVQLFSIVWVFGFVVLVAL
jgi:hypothetical protein